MFFGIKKCFKQLAGITLCVVVLLSMSCPVIAGNQDKTSLLNEVVALRLGMNGYSIGSKLTERQKSNGDKKVEAGAYQGTYKFGDNGLFVVVDKKTDRVLALYKQQKDADKSQLKGMVVELMDVFGAPTTMAHDKILYWAFNKHGVISEDDFDKAKRINQTKALDIIATVKLNSDFAITPDQKKDDKVIKKEAHKGTVYFIITSDPLVKQFMENNK
ncbi:MAG: hypothetical protein DSY50_00535 [Desulfobulbus sp.]|nr:MAG: hypothetical protein DSY58_06930 [Desulfobulbus sp.]RUM37294.1 MAG: hypothetical protein DSY50_00535 [Desulfobulbus sp.]RUM40827.1 MAG: hypothetical protein DSY70_02695 [Desulfobulbus sp.]